MNCQIGVTCLYSEHVFCSVVITRQFNPPISKFSSPCNEFTSVVNVAIQY